MTQSIIFTLLGLGLLGVAVLLVRRQFRMQQLLRKEAPEETSPLEARFGAAQCRRRIQCSVLLGALAVGMIIESWLIDAVAQVAVVAATAIGAAMLILLGWMILLAFLDILATTTHYRRMSNRYQNEQMRLEAKAKKILNDDGEEEGN